MCSTAFAGSARLSTTVVPQHYEMTIEPHVETMTFQGRESIALNVTKGTAAITVNAVDLTIAKATLDGAPALKTTVNEAQQTVTFMAAKPLSVGPHTLDIEWSGKIKTSATGLFVVDYVDDKGKPAKMLATQFEPISARSFAPLFDEPSFRATFSLSALAPKGQVAYSNMPVKNTEPVTGGSLFHFEKTPAMSSYLLFLGMGEVERKTKNVGNVEIGVITRRGVVNQADEALEAAAKLLAYYNDYFGVPYPLPKLDMIAVPGSSQFFGAMENWGAILYFERTVLVDPTLANESQHHEVFGVVAHEMAHQWFGNLVTMDWWDDLWLNEGFASWMEGKVSQDLHPEWHSVAQGIARGKQGAITVDARASSHPIIQRMRGVDEIAQAFDGITYQKGKVIIGMLEAYLTPETFRSGVREYMKTNALHNTVTDQLWSALSKVSGQNVKALMDGFTHQSGVPLIRVGKPTCVDGKTKLTLSQERYGLDEPSRVPQKWQVPVKVGIAGNAKSEQRVVVSGPKPIPLTLEGCGFAVVNLGQQGYFRTLYSPESFESLIMQLSSLALEDELGILSDGLALANAGLLPVKQHLALISQLPANSSPLVSHVLVTQLAGFESLTKGMPVNVSVRKKALNLLASLQKSVGWQAKAFEDSAVAQLREELIPTLAQFGDEGTLREAQRLLELSFVKPKEVTSDVRLTALAAAALHLDGAAWDALHTRAKAEPVPMAKELYYAALGSTVDATLAQKALDLSLTDEAPSQVRTSIIGAVSSEHPAMAFDWAVKNKTAIDGILDDTSRTRFFVGLARDSSDLKVAQRVNAFAEANLAPEARRPAKEVVLRITERAQRLKKQLPDIQNWATSP
jgi:aminopeptidase N